jgi:hypothetical protein
MTRRHWIIVVMGVVCVAALCRPAVIRTDDKTRPALFLRGQSGLIRFVNSVTDQPVRIDFRIGRRFHAFTVSTDATTEAYYTHGLYAINDLVSEDSPDHLRFCSVKGIHLKVGFYEISVKDGCLEVELLWTVW